MVIVALRAASSLLLLAGCAASGAREPALPPARVIAANVVSDSPAELDQLALLRGTLQARNPGYALRYEASLERLAPAPIPRLVLVLRSFDARLPSAQGAALAPGDWVLLRALEELRLEGAAGGLVVEAPVAFPEALPALLRAQDAPALAPGAGPCLMADAEGARSLLAASAADGAQVYRGLDLAVGRLRDSATLYHLRREGWDELLVVQAAEPGARLIFSEEVERIERLGRTEQVAALQPADAERLMRERPLAADDLVFLPRGVAHRVVGGALVHLLAIPPFRPQATRGLDARLRVINRRAVRPLDRDPIVVPLPYNGAAADRAPDG